MLSVSVFLFATTPLAAPDAELLFYEGAIFVDCEKRHAALHLLQSAIQQNYCAYSNLQLDPLLRKIRETPEFDKVIAVQTCQVNLDNRQ
jgi:hypothetical protein